MLTVKLINEFIHSPIWIYDEDDIVCDEPSIISEDSILQNLCNKVADMYSAYYMFNTNGIPFSFNEIKEKEEKDEMLDLISQIKNRLKEINDGSFVVEDCESERLNNL